MDWMRAHRFLACSGYKEDQHIPLSASSKLDYHLTAVHWMWRFLYKAHYSLSVTHLTMPVLENESKRVCVSMTISDAQLNCHIISG